MPNYFPGELHLFGHNYTGVGTRTDLRLDKDGEPYGWSKPVNAIDAVALNHDIGYSMYGDTKKGQHVLDKIMVAKLDAIPYSSLNPAEKVQKFLVRNAINIKEKLGLGVSELDQRPNFVAL